MNLFNKKGTVNILLIGVILVAVVTIITLFYTVLNPPKAPVYDFGQTDFTGNEKVLVGEQPVVEAPSEVFTIKLTGFTVGTLENGEVTPKNQFKLGETIVVKSKIEDFTQTLVDEKYVYAMEQWVATQDNYGTYIPELTAMTANFSKYTIEPAYNVVLTNKLDTTYLTPGNYTIKVFVVDRLTQDIDTVKSTVEII